MATETINFYPRSPCGERQWLRDYSKQYNVFLSTLSLRRATRENADDMYQYTFLSTLSLRRATNINSSVNTADKISIHALLAESDFIFSLPLVLILQFLSTLSLRRATHKTGNNYIDYCDFYPRSPCGERPIKGKPAPPVVSISIHALLAESDLSGLAITAGFITYFYPRSPCGERLLSRAFVLQA